MRFIICTENQFKTEQGIHLMNPDTWYVNDAVQTADRDGFETIYLHYPCKGTANYIIPHDVLQLLFTELQGTFVDVHFVHPASPNTFAKSLIETKGA